ncbi:hypothetical protein P5808_30080 [Bacillus cereus]|uniref:hypothetical protein n=1 Tax=Bacillus cereus group TaxID=86661 RepID=UPI0012F7C1A5|nr:hypothetical protein [Bacillus cereus]MDF9507406.1 hypothetical protein [Bacillus cereus]MDF9598138.1 hypothetical protein [Bacillus cereus]MDF9609690.1 hypothetical protein [Bacillus cereus]MDF9660700.1 hypothetical protein [Bacillus cereus]
MNSNVTFSMQMNGESKDATAYVSGIANIAEFLLANKDRHIVDMLIAQVVPEERCLLKLLGVTISCPST